MTPPSAEITRIVSRLRNTATSHALCYKAADVIEFQSEALAAAREEGERKGFDKAIEHCQKTGCYSAVGFLRALAAKAEPRRA